MKLQSRIKCISSYIAGTETAYYTSGKMKVRSSQDVAGS